jgi:hypothetical protein
LDQQGADALSDEEVQTFDFTGLVQAFDEARSCNPGLSRWTLTNALAQFHLGGSDTEVLGGDIAYQYGLNGTLAGIALNAAQEVTDSAQFGKQAQTLRAPAQQQESAVDLV